MSRWAFRVGSVTLIPLIERLQTLLTREIKAMRPLHGGSVSDVYRVDLVGGRTVVAKVTESGESLEIEGEMLRDLKPHLPVPEVIYNDPRLLVMTYLPGDSQITASVQRNAAEHLAALHDVRGEAFGYPRDTLIGGLHQPNAQNASWIAFFREQRLLYMAEQASRSGRLPLRVLRRIEALADKLDDFLQEPDYPSLIHGDMWTTNILAENGKVTGFIDPAIYYAHPEIELAFSTLFGTFSTPFFQRYAELRPIASGFFETRRDLYNLYPLLVHVRLFGGYVQGVESILNKLGF